MITRSGTGAWSCRDAANGTVRHLKQRAVALEVKKKVTESNKPALKIKKLFSDVIADFKNNHFAMVEQLENEDKIKAEQGILDNHDSHVVELVDHLGRLVEVPLLTKPVWEMGFCKIY